MLSEEDGGPRMIAESVITCPRCGHRATETMPTDACLFIYDCKYCGEQLKPRSGDCCVFCSYGSVPCPPVQETHARDNEDCCDSAHARSRKDWLGNARDSLLAWWLPQAAVIAGLVVTVPVRTAVWVGASGELNKRPALGPLQGG